MGIKKRITRKYSSEYPLKVVTQFTWISNPTSISSISIYIVQILVVLWLLVEDVRALKSQCKRVRRNEEQNTDESDKWLNSFSSVLFLPLNAPRIQTATPQNTPSSYLRFNHHIRLTHRNNLTLTFKGLTHSFPILRFLTFSFFSSFFNLRMKKGREKNSRIHTQRLNNTKLE